MSFVCSRRRKAYGNIHTPREAFVGQHGSKRVHLCYTSWRHWPQNWYIDWDVFSFVGFFSFHLGSAKFVFSVTLVVHDVVHRQMLLSLVCFGTVYTLHKHAKYWDCACCACCVFCLNAHRRFVEYCISASIMLTGIGIITGLRDTYSLIGVFMLCFTTMLFGILTEMLSRPESSRKWVGDPDPVEWKAYKCDVFLSKLQSYMWRMTPHFMGWFPYISAWYIVLNNFWRQIDELPENLQDRMPWFVSWAVYGTFVTFTSFSFCQIRYQWTKPEYYWK